MSSPFDPASLRNSLCSGLAPDPLPLDAYRVFYGLDRSLSACSRCEFVHFEAAGYRIAAQLWVPSSARGTLFLLHGYYDHMGLYRHLIDWAILHGLAVVICDLPGHGLSSGEPASIRDFAEYQAVLEGLFQAADAYELPAPWHLCGQSTGAAILIDYLLNAPVHALVGETILLAPLVRPRAWVRSRLSYHAMRRFVRQLPRRFTVNSSDLEFIDFVHREDPLQAKALPADWVGALARWIPKIESSMPSSRTPIVIQGDADLTVDWRYNLKILQQKFARPEILVLPGARHHLANEQVEIRARYLKFLEQKLGL
jgi:alpha-beta hydrolase superfamily lysophospholipase